MNFRFAVAQDACHLAPLNAQLIRDEGHRNSMTVEQLEQRMASWLARAEYQAVIFEQAGATTGYALFRRYDGHVYLRQFFVVPHFRRRGVGRSALNWLWANAWTDVERLRIDVLVGNREGQAFWQSVGFQPYCLTMEMGAP
jgi:GNAT superfamily N-acetyltransferase